MITREQRSELYAMNMPAPLAPFVPTRIARPWWMFDGASTRPGIGLTPQRILSAFRQAEGGSPLMQCDLFEDVLENDGSMRGQYESRLEAVAFRPWILQPGGKEPAAIEAAQTLSRALKRTNMLLLLWHLMDALGFGYAGANTVWSFDPIEGVVIPSWFLLAPHRRFLVDVTSGLFPDSGSGRLRFRTPDNEWPGEELRRGEWILAQRMHRMAVRAGLFRTTTWWAYFKRMSITDWIVFAEKFGIPMVLGYYGERASPESRAALLEAITAIGDDGQAILSDMTKIVVESTGSVRGGDVSALHPVIAQRCDAEISKVITGATLNTEGGGPGSFALGKVHEGRANAKTFGDAFWLQNVFHDCVIAPFLEYNPRFRNVEPPRLLMRVRPEMTPEVAVRVYQKLQAMGLGIEDEQMYEEFGLRRPEVGATLKPIYEAHAEKAPGPESQ